METRQEQPYRERLQWRRPAPPRAPLNIIERQAIFPHVCGAAHHMRQPTRTCAICEWVQRQWLRGKYDDGRHA